MATTATENAKAVQNPFLSTWDDDPRQRVFRDPILILLVALKR